jgi:hypothetical protein
MVRMLCSQQGISFVVHVVLVRGDPLATVGWKAKFLETFKQHLGILLKHGGRPGGHNKMHSMSCCEMWCWSGKMSAALQQRQLTMAKQLTMDVHRGDQVPGTFLFTRVIKVKGKVVVLHWVSDAKGEHLNIITIHHGPLQLILMVTVIAEKTIQVIVALVSRVLYGPYNHLKHVIGIFQGRIVPEVVLAAIFLHQLLGRTHYVLADHGELRFHSREGNGFNGMTSKQKHLWCHFGGNPDAPVARRTVGKGKFTEHMGLEPLDIVWRQEVTRDAKST